LSATLLGVHSHGEATNLDVCPGLLGQSLVLIHEDLLGHGDGGPMRSETVGGEARRSWWAGQERRDAWCRERIRARLGGVTAVGRGWLVIREAGWPTVTRLS